MSIETLVAFARQNDCSDIHLTAQLPPMFRRVGKLVRGPFECDAATSRALILSMLTEQQKEILMRGEDLDFGFADKNGKRQRVNVFHQQGYLASAIRILRDDIPSLQDLHLPPVIQNLADQPRGLVLVTGPTGSGKSTTLAAMIDHINRTRKSHIITIEDPIEYVHPHKSCVVHQRELHRDVASFSDALRSAMREDPDVILVGEMRDYETISAAVTAAETGHLVFSTLHTTSASQTLDRIVDVYPPHSQGQIRSQLSGTLRGVISQTLLPKSDNSGRVVATEILIGTDAVLNMLREGKFHQLPSAMQSGGNYGMHTLAGDLSRLVRQGVISLETAQNAVSNKQELAQYMGM
ncbi:type IV pilus twitching motility protein PilT [Eubacteriales bacterium OttesenSCG-928-K08]|nr:type IV pilus twitching motility protein PilT [Eubacteriales bacterium OttesenSCG-928-K08]